MELVQTCPHGVISHFQTCIASLLSILHELPGASQRRAPLSASTTVLSRRARPPQVRSVHHCAARTSIPGCTALESHPASPGPASPARSSEWGSAGYPCPESHSCQRDLGCSPPELHCPSVWWHHVLSGRLDTGKEMQEGPYQLGTLQMRPRRWGNRTKWWVGKKVSGKESEDHLFTQSWII